VVIGSEFCVGKSARLRRNCLGLTILSVLGVTPLSATVALAQDAPDESDYDMLLEEVIVTGSRIVTEDGFGRTSPVTVVGMEAIESFGLTRIEDILNSLPQLEADQTSFISNGATGTAALNLRGMGDKRTLVLINGRRMQPGGIYTAAPDVNQIPARMIERVEVLTGGASATYGADAVTGVVNFIMRRVDGVEVSVGASGYQHDNSNGYIQGLMDEAGYEYPTGNSGIDGRGYDASVVVGGDFIDGRGNATVYATWRKSDALLEGARDYSSCALDRFGTSCGGSLSAPVANFFIAPLTEDGLGPGGYDYWQEAFLTLQPDSSLTFFDWDNPNVYNYAPINHYMRPDERWSLGAFVDFEINEHAVVYLETMGMSDRSRAQIAESSTFFYEAYPLPLSNAYFPENFRNSLEALWPGEDDFGIYIGKRNVEGGPRVDILKHNSYRVVAGLKGVLAADWDYDVSYLHAQTASSSTYINDFYAPPLAIAVDSRLCETTAGCIPYEVFTYQGVTEAAARGVTATANATADSATTVFQAYVTGALGWGLSAGAIMAAAGYEHRRDEFERLSDSIYEDGLLLGHIFATPNLAGDYAVDELFMELNMPLLANRTFARNMTLDLAYRWSDYSASGASSTYRVGFDWQVVDWLRLRAGYNRAVRAPNIGELNGPQQLGGTSALDPCEGSEPVYTFEQCARTGVSAEQYGQIPELPNPRFWSLQALYGGNPDLEPEEADTITVGLVVEPMNSMRLSIDYWDIRIEGVIESMDTSVILDQCALDGQLCDLVHRGANGTLWLGKDAYLIGINWNLGEQHSNGVDVAWNWSPGDRWRFNLIGTYYLKKETTTIPDDPETRWDCAGVANDYHCWAKTPEWRHIASATFDSGGFWSVTGRWRYYGDIWYEDETDQIARKNLKAQNYLDLSAVLRFMGTHDLAFGVNNVLDREPPLVGGWQSTNANTLAGFYDTLGRFLFTNVTLRW